MWVPKEVISKLGVADKCNTIITDNNNYCKTREKETNEWE